MQDVCIYFLICFRPLTKQCQWKCGIFTYRTLDRHKVSISAKEYSKGNLCVYVANSCSSYSAFKIWCANMQCEYFESQHTSRSGRHSMMSTPESIDHVHDLSFADQRISNCWKIKDIQWMHCVYNSWIVGFVSANRCQNILTLTRNDNHVINTNLILLHIQWSTDNLLEHVTVDKIWLHYYDSETVIALAVVV